jgi:hypothetical protein
MLKKHPDGFAKFRARQHHKAQSTFQQLPVSRQRALRRNLIFVGTTLGLILTISLLSSAYAAGGSYVVDDAAINAPGECNIDAWYTANRHAGSSHGETLSPACTSHALPWLQWGAAMSRASHEGEGETQLSPQLKAQLWARQDVGIEVAAAATAHYALNRRHAFDGVDLSLPFTWQPLAALRLNVNAGWTHAYDDGEQHHRLTWGTGFEYSLAESLTLIAERYGQQRGDQAWQAGPRVHVAKNVDVDLVVGRSLIGGRDQWLTTGTTLRF